MKFPIFVKYSVSKNSAPCRVQRWADSNVRQGKTVGIRRGTLFGGTQAEIQDRKGEGKC